MATIGTFNEEGVNVDLYIPRKCHATNSLISAYDHSAVQIAIANVDANGVINGTTTTLCIAGYLRSQAESDHAINHLAIAKGIIRIKTGKKPRAKKGKNAKGVPARGASRGAPQQRGSRGAPAQKGSSQRGPAQKGSSQRGPAQKGAAQRGSARKPQQQQQQRGSQQARKEEGGRPQRGSKNAPQTRNVKSAPARK